MTLKDCADEFGVRIEAIETWAKRGFLTYWQAPRQRMRIERASWERYVKAHKKEGVS